MRKNLDLSTFDNKLLHGFSFGRQVYALFDQVKDSRGGMERLRLRQQRLEKKLIEELIQIASYVQARYKVGRHIKVRWFAGSQSYDAILRSSGELVKNNVVPRETVVEVTTTLGHSDYLSRLQLQEQGWTWGPKSIARNEKTKALTFTPYVYANDERATDLAEQIIKCIDDKAKKPYPAGTVLIVNCFPGNLLLDDEWDKANDVVRHSDKAMAFREIYLCELNRSYSVTLYGKSTTETHEEP